jgi:hypothetical protein
VDPNALLSKIEAAGLWAYFHKDWLLEVRRLLRPQLPPEYHVFVESEAIVVTPDEAPIPLLPDVAVARGPGEPTTVAQQAEPRFTAAVVEVEEPCEVFSKYTLLIRRSPDNRVVAAMELLSPSNKGLGNRFDRDKYLRKRDEYLEAGVNFLEVDALVAGQRALLPSLTHLAEFERSAWTALHLSGRRRIRGFGWNAADPLPVVPWWVEEGLRVEVDLGEAFQAAREFNRWGEMV